MTKEILKKMVLENWVEHVKTEYHNIYIFNHHEYVAGMDDKPWYKKIYAVFYFEHLDSFHFVFDSNIVEINQNNELRFDEQNLNKMSIDDINKGYNLFDKFKKDYLL